MNTGEQKPLNLHCHGHCNDLRVRTVSSELIVIIQATFFKKATSIFHGARLSVAEFLKITNLKFFRTA
jgi:hypothetical protein